MKKASFWSITRLEEPLSPVHHTQYSPDLAPSDFHMFGPLKEAMERKKFRSEEEVRRAVHGWLCGLQKEFFSKGIFAVCKRWRTCIEHGGDYFEN
jgi:hypothetical protein